MNDLSQEDADRFERIHENAAPRLLAIPGVRFVALGCKETGRVVTDRIAIRVHVDRKLPEADVPPAERIPAEIDGVPVDVIDPMTEAAPPSVAAVDLNPPGKIVDDTFATASLLDETKRPLVGGVKFVSGGAGRKGTPKGGTLGGILWDRDNHDRGYALTCQHVMDNNRELSVTPGRTNAGSPDTQEPSTTCKTDNIIGIYLDGDRVDLRDSDQAVVTLRPGMRWQPHVLGIGRIPKHDAIKNVDIMNLMRSGAVVRKRGVRTGLTGGVIKDFRVIGNLIERMRILPNNAPGQGRRDRVYFADEGDSGSVVVDPAGRVIGLVNARLKTEGQGGTDTVTTPEGAELVPARALPIYRVLAKLHETFASRNPPTALTLEVAWSNSDDEIFTVPGAASIVVPAELTAAVIAEPGFLGGRDPDGQLRAPVGRPWFAPDPQAAAQVVVLRDNLDGTNAGRRLNAMWTRHERELRNLVTHDRRVTLVWYRGGGSALFQLLMRMQHRDDLALPETVHGIPVAVCLERLVAVLVDRGSPALAADLREAHGVLPDLGGRTLPEILTAISRVELEARRG